MGMGLLDDIEQRFKHQKVLLKAINEERKFFGFPEYSMPKEKK
jgi:hypothetical protein